MDTLYAILTVIFGAVFIALALNYVSSQNDKGKKPRQPREKTAQKQTGKKDKKEQPKKKKATNPNKKKKVDDIKFVYDGEAEDDDAKMLEFLRGTTDQQIKDAKEERKKKAREDAQLAEKLKVADRQGKQAAKKKTQAEEEDADFKLVKEKKPKKPVKAAPVAAAPVDPNAPVAEEAQAEGQAKGEKKERKPKQKKFFKDNLAKELKFLATGKQEEPEEEAPKGKGKPRKSVDGDQTTNESKDKPAGQRKERAPREDREEGAEDAEGERRPARVRPPREAPPPPPRPLSGPYEAPTLDAMLTAISSYYGPAVKQNFFSKLPTKALTQVIRYLNLKDVISLTRVNHFLSKFCREDKVWRLLCERDFSIKIDRNSKKRFKTVYKEEYSKKNPKQQKI